MVVWIVVDAALPCHKLVHVVSNVSLIALYVYLDSEHLHLHYDCRM